MGKNLLNNKKNIKKILILLSLVVSIFTIYEIGKIFAAFYSETSGTLEQEIAKWRIVVNKQDIVKETVQEFNVEFNIENSGSTHGKLIPGMEGNFEIVIEPKTTQVSVRYDITIDETELADIDINLTKITETEKGNIITRTGINTYTGVIPVNSISDDYFNNIKITFKWETEENSDTEDINPNPNGKPIREIPITVKVSQYMGETIIEYID